MPNTKTNRDGLLVTENVRIFLMKTDGNGPGAAGKESVMNLLGMRSLGKIKEKGEKIMFWIELVIMLLLIFWGVRKGGVFLTLAGAVGAFVFTFIFKSPMSDPPLTVLRIILAVVIAGGAMQAAGGIEYLVALAEKILRKHPRSITILAPMISWLFVFCCGTGHILWSLLPIINEIAIENGVRPERPIAASVVSSQNAVCGTPLAAATAALVGFLEESGSVDMITVLMVVIPATLLGSLASGLIMMKRGKELADDPEFQRRVADGTLVLRGHKEEKVVDTSSFSKQSKISVIAFLVAMVAVVLLGVVKSLRPVLADGSTMGMTDIIQIFMLCAAAVICLVMDKKADAILEMPVFKSGVFAAVICLGLCWMVNIFIGVLVAMATSIVPMHIAGVIGAILVVVTGCISLDEAIKAFPTSTIFIVGGIFPLSKALVSSGAAEYLVNAISPVLSNLPPIILLGAITFLMLLTTQFLMNSSATVLVLPIAIMLCQAAGINPLAGAMSVSVCASGAFVTPFGTAPNLLVWEAGGYSVKDYLKCGFPMLIIFGVVTTALCAVFYL